MNYGVTETAYEPETCRPSSARVARYCVQLQRALLCIKGSCVILPQHCTKLCNVCACVYICGYRGTTFHKERLWLKWRVVVSVVWRALRLRLAETACRRWMATTTTLDKQSWITYHRWSTGWRHWKRMWCLSPHKTGHIFKTLQVKLHMIYFVACYVRKVKNK